MIQPSPAHSSDRPSAGPGRKRCGVRNFVATVQLVVASLALVSGCAGDEERPPFGGFGGAGSGNGGVATGPCDTGAQRECGYKVGEGTDSVSCYQGEQECIDGEWSECGDGMIVTLPGSDVESMLRQRRDYDTQGIAHTGGTGAACSPADLCDPYCRELSEPTPSVTAASSITNSVLCPTTTSLTECGSTVGCAHTPCQTGAGLSSTLCGACVTAVCATSGFSSCCGAGANDWTSACVAKAFELPGCGLKAQPPMSMCDFAMFSESKITSSNNPIYGSGTKIGSMDDIVIEASASAAVPGQIVTPGDVIFRNLNGGGTVNLTGPWWIGGGMHAAAGSKTLAGDIHVGRGFYEAGGISVSGSIYTSAPYSVTVSPSPPTPTSTTTYLDGQNSGSVTTAYAPTGATFGAYPTRGSTVNQTVPAPFSQAGAGAADTMPNAGVVPARAMCTAGTGTATYTGGTTTTLLPGNYGDVTIQGTGTVLLLDGEGDYFFRSLKFDTTCSNCRLQLGNMAGDYTGTARATTGNVGYNVSVCNGAFDMIGTGTRVNRYDGTALALADAKQLTVYVHSANPVVSPCNANSGVDSCSVNLGNSSIFTGLLIVPAGTFAAGNNATINGAVWSNTVITDTGFALNQINKADCESMVTAGTCNTTLPAVATCEEPPVTTTGTCPAAIVGTPTATIPGLPASNFNGITTTGANTRCRSGADCQTNLRCNNVATVATTGTCTWDKCSTSPATGAGNIAACATDPCVQRITAANAACTPGAWTPACANLIPAVCDANCSSPVGTTTGNCVDNSALTAEPGCNTMAGTNQWDLSVGYVCTANSVPVCNHGVNTYTGTVPLSWWLLSARQFAPLTTPTATATGTFTSGSVTIAPGTCTTISTATATTPMVSTNSYTVMVDPTWTKSECNVASGGNSGRRLDNWSWYNHSFTCVNTPNSAEYDYVADCSSIPDTYPRWRLLRWGAAPGVGQTVSFYARVDATAPACTGTTGGDPCSLVAANGPTSVTFPGGGGTAPAMAAGFPCALSATSSNCAVNLTTALTLPKTMAQKKNLTIRAEWPTGVATPSWDVTYTCEYDQ